MSETQTAQQTPTSAFPCGGTFWRRSQFALIAELERRQQRLAV